MEITNRFSFGYGKKKNVILATGSILICLLLIITQYSSLVSIKFDADPTSTLNNGWDTPYHFSDEFDQYGDLEDAKDNWQEAMEATDWELRAEGGDKYIHLSIGCLQLKQLNPGKSDFQLQTEVWLEEDSVALIAFYAHGLGGFPAPLARWQEGYYLRLTTAEHLTCHFLYGEDGSFYIIGDAMPDQYILDDDVHYDIKIVVSGHQFFGFVREEGGSDTDWVLFAWVTNFDSYPHSDLITPSISYDPLSTSIIENQIGWQGIYGSCNFDNFDIIFNTVYDTFSAPLGQGPGQDGKWVIDEGAAYVDEIEGDLEVAGNSRLRFPMGTQGWNDFVLEIDVSTSHQPTPQNDVWFVVRFHHDMSFHIRLAPIGNPHCFFYVGPIGNEGPVGESIPIDPLTGKNHILLVVAGNTFLAQLNQQVICSFIGPPEDMFDQFGDIIIDTIGNPQSISIDNFYLSCKSMGDDFSSTAVDDPPDPARWMCVEGTPVVKDVVDLDDRRALCLEADPIPSTVMLRNNFLPYSGFSIECDILGEVPATSSESILGYIAFGCTNEIRYAVCLDTEYALVYEYPEEDEGKKGRTGFAQGIRVQIIPGGLPPLAIDQDESMLMGTEFPELTSEAVPEDALVHLRIRVAEDRMMVYLKRLNTDDPEQLVAMTDIIPFAVGDGGGPNPFGDVFISNHPENTLYIDNFYCILDTDFDGLKDTTEIWGKATVNDIGETYSGFNFIYRFFLHRINPLAPESFDLVFRARYPIIGIGDDFHSFKLSVDTLDANDQWQLELDEEVFEGRGYWQTYVVEDFYTFPGNGDSTGAELFIRGRFSNLLYEGKIELDWIGLVCFNNNEHTQSADICDADDYALLPEFGEDSMYYFGKEIQESWYGWDYGFTWTRQVMQQRYEWEHFDYDGDHMGDRYESRIYLRSSIPFCMLYDDFYKYGHDWDDGGNPDPDWIDFAGLRYSYMQEYPAPLPVDHDAMKGDMLFSLSDGAEVYFYEEEGGEFSQLNVLSEGFDNQNGDLIWAYRCGLVGVPQPDVAFNPEPQRGFIDGREVVGLATPEKTNERFALLFAGGDGKDFWGKRYIQSTETAVSQRSWEGEDMDIPAYGFDSQYVWDILDTRDALVEGLGYYDDNTVNDFDGRDDHIATLWRWRTGWPLDVAVYNDESYCVGLDNHKAMVYYKDQNDDWQYRCDDQFDGSVVKCAVNPVDTSNYRYAVASLDGLIKILPRGDLANWEDNIWTFEVNKRITGISWQTDPSKPECVVYSYLDYDCDNEEEKYFSVVAWMWYDESTEEWVHCEEQRELTYRNDGESDHFMIHDILWPDCHNDDYYDDKILFTYQADETALTSHVSMLRYYFDESEWEYRMYVSDSSGDPHPDLEVYNDGVNHGRMQLVPCGRPNNPGTMSTVLVFIQDFVGTNLYRTEAIPLDMGTDGDLEFWEDGEDERISILCDKNSFILDCASKPTSDGERITTVDVNCEIITYDYDDDVNVQAYDVRDTIDLSAEGLTPYCIEEYHMSTGENRETLYIGIGTRDCDSNDELSGHIRKYAWHGGWVKYWTNKIDTDDYYDPDGNELPEGSVDYPNFYEDNVENNVKNSIYQLREVMDQNDILYSLFDDHGRGSLRTGSIAGPYFVEIDCDLIHDYFFDTNDPDTGYPIDQPPLDCLYQLHTFSACEIGAWAKVFNGDNILSMSSTGPSDLSQPVDNDATVVIPNRIEERDTAISRRGSTVYHYHSEFCYYYIGSLSGRTPAVNDRYLSDYVFADHNGDGYVSATEIYNYIFYYNSLTADALNPDDEESEIARLNDNADSVLSDGHEWQQATGGWIKTYHRLPTTDKDCDGFLGLLLFT